jgi:hypothetical protein
MCWTLVFRFPNTSIPTGSSRTFRLSSVRFRVSPFGFLAVLLLTCRPRRDQWYLCNDESVEAIDSLIDHGEVPKPVSKSGQKRGFGNSDV